MTVAIHSSEFLLRNLGTQVSLQNPVGTDCGEQLRTISHYPTSTLPLCLASSRIEMAAKINVGEYYSNICMICLGLNRSLSILGMFS